MTVLTSIRGPEDLKSLDPDQLPLLAAEIRDLLIAAVSRTGGHLGPNLGVVELTIAIHRVFDSPRDSIIFDVGHQSYVHKLLTGRQDFSRLRRQGGLSGYPSRSESAHDLVENQHASTALSWADGLAAGKRLTGSDGCVVAVVGDGALTGGMVWEALNNIAGWKDRPLVIVVNDNGHSYQPTIGGLADYLARLRTALEANRAAIGDHAQFMRTDVTFHYEIAQIPRNAIFTSLYNAVVEWLTEQRETSGRATGAGEAAYAAHERIYRAIAAHDPAAAEVAMERHLDAVDFPLRVDTRFISSGKAFGFSTKSVSECPATRLLDNLIGLGWAGELSGRQLKMPQIGVA